MDPFDDQLTSPTLLQRIRQGDHRAWERFVPIYEPMVRFWCSQWGLKNQEDLEDLLQDFWVSIGRTLPGYQGGSSFRVWLRAAAYHKVRDWYRRQATNKNRLLGYTNMQSILDRVEAEEEDPKDPNVIREINQLFLRAINVLRDEFKETMWRAFIACVLEGKSATEVGEEMGLQPDNVRQIRKRILQRLREELGEDG